MIDPFTQTWSINDGSSEPASAENRTQQEAVKVHEQWKARNWRERTWSSSDLACFFRHKSLVMNLAVEDYVREGHQSRHDISVSEYCRRFDGLGESLEKSIFRQLEVLSYLLDRPELLEIEFQFDWPQPGQEFLKFRVVDELGRGALARVYLCEQMQLGSRSAVVKIELGKNANEPSLLGKLRHKHIVPIHWADYDETTGASYLCMPFLGRSTLFDLIQLASQEKHKASASTIEKAARLWQRESDALYLESAASDISPAHASSYVNGIILLAVDLADALAYAHSKQVVHGDIKPSNVLLSPTGAPLLFDFNLGRDKSSFHSPAGGTLSYMAPEQLQALSSSDCNSYPKSEYATDIYAFGALLYELLGGKHPHTIPSGMSGNAAIAENLITQKQKGCVALTILNSEVDRQLAELVGACLAYDPKHRPASMREVCEQLKRHRGVVARGRRYASTHPVRFGLLGLGLLGAIFTLCLFFALRPSLLERAAVAKENGELQRSIMLYDKVLASDPDSVTARLCRARCHLEIGEYSSAHSDLEQLIRVSNEPEVSACYAYYLNLVSEPDPAVLWYQRTLNNDMRNAGILNNLSVSLLLQSRPKLLEERMSLAVPILEEALQLNPNSAVIRMNALRLVCQQLEQEDDVSIDVAIEHANWLTNEKPECADVWESVGVLFRKLADRKLIDESQVDTALEKKKNSTDATLIPRFIDPLTAE